MNEDAGRLPGPSAVPGLAPTGGALADRLQELLDQAVDEQLAERRRLVDALIDLGRQVHDAAKVAREVQSSVESGARAQGAGLERVAAAVPTAPQCADALAPVLADLLATVVADVVRAQVTPLADGLARLEQRLEQVLAAVHVAPDAGLRTAGDGLLPVSPDGDRAAAGTAHVTPDAGSIQGDLRYQGAGSIQGAERYQGAGGDRRVPDEAGDAGGTSAASVPRSSAVGAADSDSAAGASGWDQRSPTPVRRRWWRARQR